jgi:glutamate-ammonia-ligase adenylyltransferase
LVAREGGDGEAGEAPGLPARVAETLARGPEPERTSRLAGEVLAAARRMDGPRLAALERERTEVLARVLFACCGAAPFLAGWLRREPAWLFALGEDRDLAHTRPRDVLEARLAAALAEAGDRDPASALRRFKYGELARITVRDCSEEWVPEERVGDTLAELSWLAEVLLSRTLALEADRLAEEAGPPIWRDASGTSRRLAFAVLGLGKLGGGELNYSSDVDLVYVYESPPPDAAPLADGPQDLTPREYFERLATRFGRQVQEASGDGFLYRVDLELRPEGAQGLLVSSSDALVDYYDGWAATWEKAAFMKARPVAGELALGWRVVRAIHPMIYRSSMDLAGVAAIREMKERIEEQHTRDPRFHVKLGPGGIRDVEFIAQALQLLHGGRIPQVRGRSAPGALRALAEVGVLDPARCTQLVAAYAFLRRLENRIQMEAERQTHWLPPAGAARERLALALDPGPGAADRLDARLAEHTTAVRAVFSSLFEEGEADRVMDLLARAAPRLLAAPQLRAPLEALAARLTAEIRRSADPDRALNNLARFIEGVGARSFYYGLLLDRPELVPRLVHCFAGSRFLSGILATLPQLIEPVFADPEKLVLSRPELQAELAEIRAQGAAPDDRAEEETRLAAIRLFQQRELVNVGLLDLDGKIASRQVEEALTDVAEVCLEEALAVAGEQLARRSPAAARTIADGAFLVVGMGKLGSRELTYGSDLDVIFLYDRPGADAAALAEAQEPFVRLAQKLAWALQTRTAEGVCYEVDARLRPSGNQGMLVTSLAAFERYHRESAWLWERQTLLRARPVAGSASLGERFRALREQLLLLPLPEEVAGEIHRVRGRMEAELAREEAGRRNLKTGRGGLLDVESVVQYLQLRHGAAHRELLEPQPVELLLDRIEAADLLAEKQVADLRAGWSFLQRLSSRLRIVENRSISDLQAERTDLDSVARALGYTASPRTGRSARLPLLEDYARHTDAIRAVYRAVLAPEA